MPASRAGRFVPVAIPSLIFSNAVCEQARIGIILSKVPSPFAIAAITKASEVQVKTPVTWQTIWLCEPQRLSFPNGQPFVAAVESIDWDDLSIELSSGPRLILRRAIDADERFDCPRIHLFAGTDPAELFFFGGPAAYRVRSDGGILERLETHRDLASYECGSLDVITERNLAVIVYEVGILVIGDDLCQRWLRRKYIGRQQIAVDDGILWLREPHLIPIGHRLSDGELISAPEDYSPGIPYDHPPDEREVFDACVKSWNREAIISAFQAVASHLAALAQGSAEIDTLRISIAAEIERMTADGSARPARGFAADAATRWSALGLDAKRLFGVAVVDGVYKRSGR